MRSRYSAFAQKQVGYLWKTLHPEHPDRSRPEEEVLRELREIVRRHKYPGLRILEVHEAAPGTDAEVVFHARVFESGRERSVTERSRFRQDGTGWRYLSGTPEAP